MGLLQVWCTASFFYRLCLMSQTALLFVEPVDGGQRSHLQQPNATHLAHQDPWLGAWEAGRASDPWIRVC